MKARELNMIVNGYKCWMYDVCFNHPDDSSFHTCVCYVDESGDICEKNGDEFLENICKEIWEKYNHSHYYHDMEISCNHIIDHEIYTTHTRYNGYEVEKQPTTIQKIKEV